MKRSSIRLLLGAAALAAAIAAVAVLLPTSPGEAGRVAVPLEVLSRSGAVLFNGTIEGDGPTALSVLEAASAQAGFALDVRRGLSCADAYVVSVAGEGEAGRGGWTYQVSVDGGAWWSPGESGACCDVREGVRVRWLWSEEGVLGPACP